MNNAAEWLKGRVKTDISPLGSEVAAILDTVFDGIYNLAYQVNVNKADWANKQWIELSVPTSRLATFDSNGLTILVFMAHLKAIRVEIMSSSPRYIKLGFSQRQREGSIYDRHPSLQDAVDAFLKCHSDGEPEPLPEVA